MKRMCLALVTTLCLFIQTQTATGQQVVINEVLLNGSDDIIELKNLGDTSIDVATWWICYQPIYRRINTLTLSGSTLMAPGDVLSLSGSTLDLNAIQEDIGLYRINSFGSPDAMIDFVQYGATGDIGRTDVAVAKGIWSLADAVATPSAGSSIEYDGVGNGAENWVVTATPSIDADNALAVCEGGRIEFSTGGTTARICSGDGIPDPLDITISGQSNADYGFFITDDQGDILGFTTNATIDLNSAPGGTCRVYGFSSIGSITNNAMGQSVSNVAAVCCSDLSENWVEITRTYVDGATVDSDFGSTVVICKDGSPDPVTLTNTTASTESYAYIITDNNGNVLAFPPSNIVDLDGAPLGVCRVYGISYSGILDTTTGVAIGDVISDACFDLSDNWVEITRTEPDGATVDSDFGSAVVICKDGTPDPVTLTNSTTSALSYSYIITDNNGNVLAFPPSNIVDLDGAPLGVCRVYGISYSGTLDTTTGVAIGDVTSDACFDLSDNWVEITRTEPEGATVDSDFGSAVVICKDGTPDPVTLTNSTTSALSYSYIITDNNGNVLAFPPSNIVDLDGAPLGVCRVYGISYSGTLDTTTGVAIGDVTSDACFDLSDNWVEITRTEPDGATVDSDFGSAVVICKDGTPDPVSLTNSTTSALPYAYIITDNNGNVLAFPPSNIVDLDGAPLGVCRVYGISYSGTLDTTTGVAIGDVTSDACFDLSDNWVEITRTEPDGATVDSDFGSAVVICKDGTPDPITLTNSTTSALSYSYIITDNNGNVLAFPPSKVVDLDGAPPGVCRVYGISYSGTLDTTTGVAIGDVTSDACFDLSDNWVEITRTLVDGGMVMSEAGFTELAICLDSTPDPINIVHLQTATNQPYAYIVTDGNGVVLAFPSGATIDLNGAPPGVCRIYGISYTGTLNTTTGTDISEVTSTACWNLSDNYVEVTRDNTGAPCESQSTFIENAIALTADEISFTVKTTFGETYTLQSTLDLINPSWQDVQTEVMGNGTIQTISVPLNGPELFRHYRLTQMSN